MKMSGVYRNYRSSLPENFFIAIILFALTFLALFFNYHTTSRLRLSFVSPNAEKSLLSAHTIDSTATISNISRPPKNYLVWSEKCHMPNVEPFTDDIMKVYKPQNYINCSNEEPLTTSVYDMNSHRYVLRINRDLFHKFIQPDDEISCCYQEIQRSGNGNDADRKFKLSLCSVFGPKSFDVPLHIDWMIVTCKSVKLNAVVQRDAHFFIQERENVRQRLAEYHRKITTTITKTGERNHKAATSVLMIGIDSLSRFNFRRTMPKTMEHLQKTSWIEMAGYNKIGDNTYPNLMALLTGYNLTTAEKNCRGKEVGGLDECPFIWKLFKALGYVTAYAEDETWMSTFNYLLKGFHKPPVDYYQRPFMMAVEKTLKTSKLSGMTYCTGMKHAAEYVYDYAVEIATRYMNEPYFGLFWANTFSHNSYRDSSSMDERMVKYLKDFEDRGILDTAIVIFFSDHGSRWGPLRNLPQGFLEARLPFLFIHLPKLFRLQHPQYVNALEVNRNRLTNPYDIHMTLRHILELSSSEAVSNFPTAEDCPNCQTIFRPVPQKRSCKEVAIPDHWCTCVPYDAVKTNSKEVVEIVNLIIDQMNFYIKNQTFGMLCHLLKMKSVTEANKKIFLETVYEDTGGASSNVSNVSYRIRFEANPKEAEFEATALYSSEKHSVIVDVPSISRLDAYDSVAKCVDNKVAKKFCICKDR